MIRRSVNIVLLAIATAAGGCCSQSTAPYDAVKAHGGDINDYGILCPRTSIDFLGSKLDDAGLAQIIPSLRALHVYNLRLTGTNVSDSGICLLRSLPTLVSLDVSWTHVTLQRMSCLAGMPRFEGLSVDPRTSDETIRRVREQLPGVEVSRDYVDYGTQVEKGS